MQRLLVIIAVVVGQGCSAPGDKADGAAIYEEACARCHGSRGAPPPAMATQLGVPSLISPDLHVRLSDKELRRRIEEGSPAKGMPAFAGALSPAEIDAVAEHVRTLAKP